MSDETKKTVAGHEAYFRDGARFVGCARCDRASWQSGATHEEQLQWLDRERCPGKKLCMASTVWGPCTMLAPHDGDHCAGACQTKTGPEA